MKNFLQFCGYVLMQSTDAERKIKWKKIRIKMVQYFKCSTVHIIVHRYVLFLHKTPKLHSYLYLHG